MLLGALILAATPLTNAERAAVQIAAERLAREPAARWQLQTTMPAVRERMAAFTAGDDTVIFEMANEAGAYWLRDVRTLERPVFRKPLFPRAPSPPIRDHKLPLALALLAAALTAGAAFLPRAQIALIAAAAALVITSTWSAFFRDERLRPPIREPGEVPRAAIQEARAALARNDASGAVLAYQHALSLGPGRDALWLEAADAMRSLGYDERAAAYLQRLARIGSRDSEVYYSLATLAGNAGRDDEAEQWLRQAWALRPVPRERLVGAPAFAPLLRRESFARLISLGSIDEPLVVSPHASTQPIELPPDARARTSGELLEITIGTHKLLVPGGAALAPKGTPVVAASDERTENELLHRSRELHRLHRDAEAKALLFELAKQRAGDPATLNELAELFASFDLYDAAVKTYDRSQRIRPNGVIDERVRQIRMNQRLAATYLTTKTRHFEIRYPPGTGALLVSQLGDALESELRELQEWIPVPDPAPIAVNVVPWEEFRSIYTQSDSILGFYNRGRITIPLASRPDLPPQASAVLRHELTHALLAQATNDRAPRWFHEGLAQLMEPRARREAGFRIELPVTLLDAVLRRSQDPEVITTAYELSLRNVLRYDRARLQQMIRAFRNGATTREVIAR